MQIQGLMMLKKPLKRTGIPGADRMSSWHGNFGMPYSYIRFDPEFNTIARLVAAAQLQEASRIWRQEPHQHLR